MRTAVYCTEQLSKKVPYSKYAIILNAHKKFRSSFLSLLTGIANSEDPYQTAPSGSALFDHVFCHVETVNVYLSQTVSHHV